MVATVDSIRLRLKSKPYKHRTGLVPMIFALSIGFAFSCLWFGVAAWMMLQSGREFVTWGIMIVLSTLAYCAYLGIAGYKIYADSRRQYIFEMTPTEAIITTIDHMREKKTTQMVLLADVKYIEYYPYPDCSSAIFHAPYTDMEVPLWPFGAQAQDVLDFLTGRGIQIVNVNSDDKIPD